MDILTHTLSGLAVGTVVASFSKKKVSRKFWVIGLGGFAGALPDLDAISLWSGFDSTFGRLFNLNHSGKDIYSDKFWYSHHAFMHSIVAAFLFATIIGTMAYFINTRLKKLTIEGLMASFKRYRVIHVSFIAGFLIHLIEDMVTPASTWGGVALFWPSKTYIGGWGNIWWWNNYDIFLIVLSVLLLNLILLTMRIINRSLKQKMVTGLFILGFIFSGLQIKSRSYDFSYSGYTNRYIEYEKKSKELQMEILGSRLYNSMQNFDNKLKIYF